MSAPSGTTERLITTGDAAALLGVHAMTVRRYVGSGRLRAQRLPSGVYRFRREDVERLLTPSGVSA